MIHILVHDKKDTVGVVVIEGLKKPDISQKIVNAGFFVEAKSAKAYGERIAREVKQFGEIIKQAGIKPKKL